jgi:hypothetical protein
VLGWLTVLLLERLWISSGLNRLSALWLSEALLD